MHTSKIICVLGRSGAGKDTLVKKYCDKYNKTCVISYTTRKPRPGERNTHIFISPEEVKSFEDQMVAYTKINDCEYFATKDQLFSNTFYIIDPLGYYMLKDKCREDNVDVEIKSIYISAPEELRASRASIRGDGEETFKSRIKDENLQFDIFEMGHEYDYRIENVDLDQAFCEFESIIKKEDA